MGYGDVECEAIERERAEHEAINESVGKSDEGEVRDGVVDGIESRGGRDGVA